MSDKTTTKRLKLAGLLAIAAMAVMAVASAAAFGFSEYKTASFPVSFHGVGGLSTFTTEGGATIMCNKSLSEGKIESSSQAKVLVSYSGNCKLAGAIAGNGVCKEPIMTQELTADPATIVGLRGSNRGQLFRPATAGGPVANLKCGSKEEVSIKVVGGAICEGSPSGKLTFTGTVTCSQFGSTNGRQLYKTAEVGGLNVAAALTAEATDIFTITEKDDQATEETLTYSALIEQT